MKKFLTVSILTVIFIMLVITGVNAATNANLPDTLYAMGAKYGMTSADRVRLENYLADYPVTDEEADEVVSIAKSAVNLMEETGVTDYKKLSEEDKTQIRTYANEAADILEVSLSFKSNSVEVYKEGKLIDTVTDNGGRLAYTGNNSIVLVVSSIAVIALVAFVVAGKKLANA